MSSKCQAVLSLYPYQSNLCENFCPLCSFNVVVALLKYTIAFVISCPSFSFSPAFRNRTQCCSTLHPPPVSTLATHTAPASRTWNAFSFHHWKFWKGMESFSEAVAVAEVAALCRSLKKTITIPLTLRSLRVPAQHLCICLIFVPDLSKLVISWTRFRRHWRNFAHDFSEQTRLHARHWCTIDCTRAVMQTAVKIKWMKLTSTRGSRSYNTYK